MYNYSRLDSSIKKIVNNLINNIELTDIEFGEVIKVDPLEIKLDQMLILNKNQLLLTRNVSNFQTKFSFDNNDIKNVIVTSDYDTDLNKSEPKFQRFIQPVKNEITIYNELEVGEKVLMLKLQGGQKYLVLDRVGDW